MVDAKFHSHAWHHDHGTVNRRMAQEWGIEGTQTERDDRRGPGLDPARTDISMGWHLPHREKSLDLFVYALQRRLGAADSLRFLCVHGLEGLEEMGLPVDGG